MQGQRAVPEQPLLKLGLNTSGRKNLGKSSNHSLLHKIIFLLSIPNFVLVRVQIYQQQKKYISNRQIAQKA